VATHRPAGVRKEAPSPFAFLLPISLRIHRYFSSWWSLSEISYNIPLPFFCFSCLLFIRGSPHVWTNPNLGPILPFVLRNGWNIWLPPFPFFMPHSYPGTLDFLAGRESAVLASGFRGNSILSSPLPPGVVLARSSRIPFVFPFFAACLGDDILSILSGVRSSRLPNH